jgi:Na+/H+-dicarboxylate symporter
MIVAPLVFTTLVVGVAKLGDIKAVGRIGGKTLLWFISASLMSLLLGMILVNFFEPGKTMHLALPDSSLNLGLDKSALSLKDFFYHVFPASFVDAMAKN